MKRLQAIADKGSRIVVGLMSGTSHDGVDAAVARIKGAGAGCCVELLGLAHAAYPAALRQKVRRAFEGTSKLICSLNYELGEFFAAAALDVVIKAGLEPSDVDLVGSHGQTVYHSPPDGDRTGSTLQLGEGAVIARRTGAVTISDFRSADIAAGGHGAPLAPLADWLMFKKPGKVTALQNIGGIASVSVVTEAADGVYGFDTGPGNALLDETVRIISGGKTSFDNDGNIARSGDLIPELYRELLANPYYGIKPPKTTGRELFGRKMAEQVVSQSTGSKKEDLICTLTHLTAGSIRAAYEDFIFPSNRVDRVVLCGGGALNGFLVSLISGLFEDIPVVTLDELGIPAMAREALIFAVLANETLAGNPGNVPAATGAVDKAVLGKLSL